MVLSCQNISKSFGTDVILKQASFHMEEYEKAAIVGINGAGKSTLLKIIIKELEPDEGVVSIAKDQTIGYLAQNQVIDSGRTIYEEVLSAKQPVIAMEQQIRGMEAQMHAVAPEELEAFMEKYERLVHQFELADGYTYRSEVIGVLTGLGFTEGDFTKTQAELSGGQKTRVALCRLLVTKPDILLLDEPTNHLDMESIQWLENFLLNYKGAVLIVSHDRYFMDKIVSKVIEVFQHQVHSYSGNYTAYAQKKAQVRAAQLRAYMNQQQEIRHQEEVIAKLKSFNREKSIRRAGMDYWPKLEVYRYMNFEEFREKHSGAKIWMATTKAERPYTEAAFGPEDFIMFGKESAGIPEKILVNHKEECVRIPMLGDIRSLNLGNSVAVILYEALRQNGFAGMGLAGQLHEMSWA